MLEVAVCKAQCTRIAVFTCSLFDLPGGLEGFNIGDLTILVRGSASTP